MKTNIRTLIMLFSELKPTGKSGLALLLLIFLTPHSSFSQNAAREPAIIDRGPHHSTTLFVSEQAGKDGALVLKTNRYVTLANGLNRWDTATRQWKESTTEIELLEDGAIAQGAPHKVVFLPNLNAGTTELFLPDGQRLRTRILGIVYADIETGQRTLVAELQDAEGVIAGNRVIYSDAFKNISADVVLTYTIGGYEQDLVMKERPLIEELGFRPEFLRIEIWTEFFDPPQYTRSQAAVTIEPNQVNRLNLAEPDVWDELMDFGSMSIGPGAAFLRSEPNGADYDRTLASVRVAKQWIVTPDHRTFLVESVAHSEIKPLFKDLPLAAMPRNPPRRLASVERRSAKEFAATLPKGSPTFPKSKTALRVAHANLQPRGVVFDYIVLNTITNLTLTPGTFYVKDLVSLSSTTTISGGVVVKYTNTWGSGNGPKLFFQGPVVWNTSPFNPAIFTAKDDDSVGDTIAGSTGVPSGLYGEHYLSLGFTLGTVGGLKVHDVIMRYPNVGFHNPQGREITLDNAQLSNGDFGLFNKETFKLRNVLFYKMGRPFTGQFTNAVTTAEHLTVHSCNALIHGSTLPAILLTNSLLISVTNGVRWSGAHVETNLNDAGIFTNVVAGGHYLPASSPYHGVGTTNLSTNVLASIRTHTVTAPTILTSLTNGQVLAPWIPLGTGPTSLGYHYPVLDYIIRTAAVANATVLFTNGVSIGIDTANTNFGILLGENAHLISQGTPLGLNRFVRLHSVQEGRLTNTLGSATFANLYTNAPSSTLRLKFTDLPLPAGDFYHLKESDAVGSLLTVSVKDSQLRGGIWKYSTQNTNQTCAFTNNLWESTTLEMRPSVASTAHFQNNTFSRGTTTLVSTSGVSWSFYDNLFDATTINQTGSGTIDHNFNGYTTNAVRLSPAASNDVVLATSNVVYAAGALGNYYTPSTSVLVDAGHTNANRLGLYHYTTRTNQLVEGQSMVDIGLHYVALNDAGWPLDSDEDGWPDVIEDVNGNGIWEPSEVSGLRWWLKADAGITKNGSDEISSWADQSPWGNHATQGTTAAKPILVTNVLNGLPVVEFDGLTDILDAVTTPATNNFNVLAVVRATAGHEIDDERSVGTGGTEGQRYALGEFRISKQGTDVGLSSVSIGTNGISVYEYQAVTTGQNQVPALTVHSAAVGTNFSLFGVSYVDGQSEIAINGARIRKGFQSSRSKVFAPAQIGGSTYGITSNYFKGQIAEIVLYDDTLTDAKYRLLREYLNQKYSLVVSTPAQPTNLQAYAVSPTQISLLWRGASADTSEFELERKLGSGGSYESVTNLPGSVISHLDDGLTPSQQYYYRVRSRNLAGVSAYSAVVNATTLSSGGTIPVTDVRLWLKADAQVQRDATAKIDRWDDQSGYSNHARQYDVSERASWADDQVNSRPSVHFDGTNDEMLVAFEAGVNSFTVFAIARPVTGHEIDGERNSEWGKTGQHYLLGNATPGSETPPLLVGDGCASGLLSVGTNGFSAYEFHYNSTGQSGAPPLAVGSNTVGTSFALFILDYQNRIPAIYQNGTLVRQGQASTRAQVYAPVKIGGANIVGGQPFEGDASEILVFNRSLLAEERDAVGGYLKHKYGLNGVAPNPPTNLTATAASSTALQMSWGDRSTNESSFKLERKAGAGGSYAVIGTIGSDLTNFCDTGATSTITYYYRIKAVNYFGDSAYSTQIAPPTIAITSPTNRTRFTTGSTNSLTTTVADDDGSVTQVVWFANSTSIGTTTNSPFSLNWVPNIVGSVVLKAQATDNQGNTRLSALIHITVDLDTDQDGLSDLDELASGTDPNDSDTDGDGLKDGLDPFPTHPLDPGDTTAPVIELLEPTDAQQL